MFINNAYAETTNTETITVQDAGTVPPAPPAVENGWTSFIPMIAIFAVFYFFLIRPQEKRRKLQESLVSGVKKGEEVLTSSGIFGTVTKIDDSENIVHISIAKDVEIKILKNTIADIVSRKKTDGKVAIEDKKTKAKPEAKAKGKKKA